MDKNDEFELLGNSANELPTSHAEAKIESFPNPSPGRDYWIDLSTNEFTSLCPVTGQPDFGRITIRYVPNKSCIETKSLKFYLNAYRNETCFNETVVNWILDDLLKACSPKKMSVRGKFASRGGIRVTAEACYPEGEEPASWMGDTWKRGS